MCRYTYTGGVPVATKTITIDLEACERLVSVRRENESFSQAIKRAVKPPLDVDAYLTRLQAHPMSEQAAEAW